EESLTASSIPTVRSLGIAFGAAITGLLANAAGLDRGIGGATVAAAVTLIDSVATLAPILAVLLALRLLRVSPAAATPSAPAAAAAWPPAGRAPGGRSIESAGRRAYISETRPMQIGAFAAAQAARDR